VRAHKQTHETAIVEFSRGQIHRVHQRVKAVQNRLDGPEVMGEVGVEAVLFGS